MDGEWDWYAGPEAGQQAEILAAGGRRADRAVVAAG